MVYDGTATIRENSVRTKGVRPMIVQLQKQRSKILEKLLDALSPDFDKLQPKIDAVFQQGRKEGFDDMEIGELVRSQMKEHYSDRTIRRVLPEAAKQKQDHSKQKADKMSTSERQPIEVPADKVSVEPITDVATEQPQQPETIPAANHSTEIKAPPSELSQSQVEHQISESKLEQPGRGEIQGIPNIAPEDCDLRDLHLYDRDTLIKIVLWMDERDEENPYDLLKFNEQVESYTRENADLRKENELLKKENEEYRRLPNNDALYNKIDIFKRELNDLDKQLEEAKHFTELLSLLTSESKARRLARLKEELAVLKERGLEAGCY
jgi:hypothetical protein